MIYYFRQQMMKKRLFLPRREVMTWSHILIVGIIGLCLAHRKK